MKSRKGRRARIGLRAHGWALLVALSIPASGCLTAGAVGDLMNGEGEAGRTLGRFSVTLPSAREGGEAWKVTDGMPDFCRSGEHQFFFGADFPSGKERAVLRLVVDPLDGAAVRAFDLDDPEYGSVVFRASDCATFRYRLEPSGWRINDFQDFQVELEVDCDTGDGTILKAEVSARHCS